MSDDWDLDDEPVNSGSSTPAVTAPPPRAAAKARWQGEDEEEEQDDWDASEDEKPKPTTSAPAPAKKKKTLKQIIAEKEKLAAEKKLHGDDDELIDTMTQQERRRLARERELEADLAVAGDLMGSVEVEDKKADLEAVLKAEPKTKDDFANLSKQIMNSVISRHESNALFSAFVEQLSKDLCESLTAVQTRKVSSSLNVLGNTKQQEERDKASGKKKPTNKPKLGAAKSIGKADTEAYDDVLDDDDFM